MRSSDILLVLSALGGVSLGCAAKGPPEATEVPASPKRGDADASCRHDLGRCGGHTPGDGACGGESVATKPVQPLGEVLLAPGKFAEINLEMGEGSTIEVEYRGAGGSLEWNVHSHDGDNVVIHAEGVGITGKLPFSAPRAGLYSYLWKNAGSTPVRLTTHLNPTGTVRVHSVHPAP